MTSISQELVEKQSGTTRIFAVVFYDTPDKSKSNAFIQVIKEIDASCYDLDLNKVENRASDTNR